MGHPDNRTWAPGDLSLVTKFCYSEGNSKIPEGKIGQDDATEISFF